MFYVNQYSENRQQHEAAKYDHAAAQGERKAGSDPYVGNVD